MPSCSVCRLVLSDLSEGRIRIITSPPCQLKQCKNSSCPAATRTYSGVHYIAGQPERRLRVWVDEEGQWPCERPPLGGSTQLDTHGRCTPEDICVWENVTPWSTRAGKRRPSEAFTCGRNGASPSATRTTSMRLEPRSCNATGRRVHAGSLSAAKSRSLRFFHPSPAFSKRHSSYITR